MATNTRNVNNGNCFFDYRTRFLVLYQIEQLAHQVPWSKGILKNNQGKKLSL